jgi:hypothetical protein
MSLYWCDIKDENKFFIFYFFLFFIFGENSEESLISNITCTANRHVTDQSGIKDYFFLGGDCCISSVQ